jgi:hypothetical protein
LRDTKLEYAVKNNQLGYIWTNSVTGFNMPVKVTLNGKEELLQPETWKNYTIN